MNYEERIRAFEMRLSGQSWPEIAQVLGYSKSVVELDLKACIYGRRKCIYPALAEILTRDFCGNLSEFARACGVPYGTLYNCMSGRTRPNATMIYRICETTGLTAEEAFREEEETE